MDKSKKKISLGITNSRLKDAVFISLIIIVIFTLYHPMLNNYFFEDDFGNILIVGRSNFIFSFSPRSSLWSYEYRPLKSLIWQLGYFLFGKNPAGYYLLNIIIHIINSILLFYLYNRFINNTFISFLSAVLFSVFKVHAEATYWISAANISFAAIFYLSCLLSFINFLKYRQKLYYVLALVCFFIGLFIHENAVSLIAVLFFYEFLLRRRDGYSLRQAVKYLPFLLILCIYLILHWLTYISSFQPSYSCAIGIQTLKNYLLMTRSFLCSLFWPDINTANLISTKGNFFIFGTAVISALLLLIIYGSGKLKFAALWFLLSYFPFAVIKGGFAFESRWTYLIASAFIFLISMPLFQLYKFSNLINFKLLRLMVIIIFIYLISLNYIFTRSEEKKWENKGRLAKDILTQLKEKYPAIGEGDVLYLKNIPSGIPCEHIKYSVMLEYEIDHLSCICDKQNLPLAFKNGERVHIFEYADKN